MSILVDFFDEISSKSEYFKHLVFAHRKLIHFSSKGSP